MGGLQVAAVNRRKSLYALRQYGRKLLQPATWRKILSFKVNTKMVSKALLDHETASAAERKAESVVLARFRRDFRGRILFIHGSNDPETKGAAVNYARFCVEAGIPAEQHEIAGANHSYYSLAWEREVMDLTERWLIEQ
jgi:acetyl esterase/lipase